MLQNKISPDSSDDESVDAVEGKHDKNYFDYNRRKSFVRDFHLADSRENALKAYDRFIETFGAKYEKAVENLKKDKDDLFRFYDFPAEHWTHIRTSNPIESTFATVRLRHNSTKGNGTAKASIAMAFKLCQQAEKGWRRLRGFEKLSLVAKDIIFEDGVLKEVA